MFRYTLRRKYGGGYRSLRWRISTLLARLLMVAAAYTGAVSSLPVETVKTYSLPYLIADAEAQTVVSGSTLNATGWLSGGKNYSVYSGGVLDGVGLNYSPGAGTVTLLNDGTVRNIYVYPGAYISTVSGTVNANVQNVTGTFLNFSVYGTSGVFSNISFTNSGQFKVYGNNNTFTNFYASGAPSAQAFVLVGSDNVVSGGSVYIGGSGDWGQFQNSNAGVTGANNTVTNVFFGTGVSAAAGGYLAANPGVTMYANSYASVAGTGGWRWGSGAILISNTFSGGVLSPLSDGYINESFIFQNNTMGSGASAFVRIYPVDSGSYSGNVWSGGTLQVESAKVFDDVAISGGRIVASAGGFVDKPTIGSGGSLLISNSGRATQIVASGGQVFVYSGGSVSQGSVSSGGVVSVFSGGQVGGVSVGGGGTVSASGAQAVVSDTVVFNSGVINILSGATAQINRVSSGGKELIGNSGYAFRTTVTVSGEQSLTSGAAARETVVSSGGGAESC